MGQTEPAAAKNAKKAAGKRAAAPPGERGLAHLHRATDTLSSLLAQEVKDLNDRQKAAHAAGEADHAAAMKSLKEATAVLKDLAAVAKTLNEQGTEAEEGACGVVLLPPVEQEGEERL